MTTRTLPTFNDVFDKIDYYKRLLGLTALNSSKQTAYALGVDDTTLRKSRRTGYLLGVEAPEHEKRGHSVQYRIEAIIDYVEYSSNKCVEGM